MKMNPPLRDEADRQALIEGLRSGRHRLRRDRPRPARAATRRRSRSSRRRWARPASRPSFAALYTELVRPGVLSLGLLVERMTRGGALFGLPIPRIAVGRAGEPLPRRPRRDLGGRRATATRAARRTRASPAASCRAASLLTVAAGSVAYRERAFAVAAAPEPGEDARMSAGLLDRDRAALVVIDVQEAFRKAVPAFEDVARAAPRCSSRAREMLGVPVLVTEQYPNGLGDTVPEVAEHLGDSAAPAQDRLLGRARRRLRPRRARPGARLRDRDARLRQPDRRTTCSPRDVEVQVAARRGRLAHRRRPRHRRCTDGAGRRGRSRASRPRSSSCSARRARPSSRRSRS